MAKMLRIETPFIRVKTASNSPIMILANVSTVDITDFLYYTPQL